MKQLRVKSLLIDISLFVETVKPISMFAARDLLSIQKHQIKPTEQSIGKEANRLVQYLVCRLMEEQFLVCVLNYCQNADDSQFLIRHLRKHEIDFEKIFRTNLSILRLTDIPDFISIQIKHRDLMISMS